MAALEKIRKRAVILTIVIGAGLLAFILEEAVRASGAFTTDTLAAKVGDEKIEMQEFQNLSQMRQQAQDPDSKTDAAVIQQQLLQEVIQEKLYWKITDLFLRVRALSLRVFALRYRFMKP